MLELRRFAHSDRGRVRPANQDTAYAGTRLLAVADGFGPAGAPASSAAVEALRFFDTAEVPAGSVLDLLEDAVRGATGAVRDAADGSDDNGTTLTALLWTGSRLALVHIGDSRACLLRDGELFRITHDHTVVQSLIDEGRLTEEEATAHPQRTLLLKVLGTGTPDLRLHDAAPGDRYLLCSDGLPTVLPEARIRQILTTGAPDTAVRGPGGRGERGRGPRQRERCGGGRGAGGILIVVGGVAGVGTRVSLLPSRMECIACPLSFPPWRARASGWLCASATGP